MEHWLPLFHERLETLLDYCAEAVVTADHQTAEAFEARHELITDYYDARHKTGAKGGMTGARRLQARAAGTALSQAVGMGRACSKATRSASSPASMPRPAR